MFPTLELSVPPWCVSPVWVYSLCASCSLCQAVCWVSLSLFLCLPMMCSWLVFVFFLDSVDFGYQLCLQSCNPKSKSNNTRQAKAKNKTGNRKTGRHYKQQCNTLHYKQQWKLISAANQQSCTVMHKEYTKELIVDFREKGAKTHICVYISEAGVEQVNSTRDRESWSQTL